MASDYIPGPYPSTIISGGLGVGATQASKTVSTAAAAASLNASDKPARLFSLTVLNTGSAQYVQIFDASSLPGNGAVPKIALTIAATASSGPFNFEGGIPFTDGIQICNSSTAGTKTLGSANCLFTAAIG